jgi:hypothetical protein
VGTVVGPSDVIRRINQARDRTLARYAKANLIADTGAVRNDCIREETRIMTSN